MTVQGLLIHSLTEPLIFVFEAVNARQKPAKKRSLQVVNEHFESVFNTAVATQIGNQQPANG
ncbi:MAG: hypothetical protein CMI06_09810 [Oceanospirillaceae bacterium]|nr:hypothetical protein [Oceanospirillaceae bacterium]